MNNWTEFSAPTRSRSNTVLSGYLRRSGRAGKTLGLRQKRYYKLDGAILSKHLTENSSAIWDINVQGAQIGRLGRCNFGIRLNKLEKRAAKDFQNNLIVLYSRTEDECNVWVSALRNASQRKLEDYYEVMDLIGEGGFAKVRLGRCLTTNQNRAIKTMNKAEAHAKVLGTEVAVIKRVDHPNIVKTFDIFETSEQIHIVMEYMEGGMLYDAIEDGVQFDEVDVIQFTREILDGLHYLHEVGIVHRDIKPENVLCTSKNTPLHVKIADFGLSSISTVADMKANRMLMSTMIGTPEFVAPEIARQQTYTEKVDMWAMGMLCYNVIARRLPMDESRDMIQQIQDGITLSFPEPEWECYSPLAKSFVRSLLCEDPEKRLSPLGCLTHRWLQTAVPEQSTKFAAHGRMSNMLFMHNAQQLRAMKRHRELNVKKAWLKAYMSVSALCKLTKCCEHLKIFDSANLRAISVVADPRAILTSSKNSQEYVSDSSEISMQMQVRMLSVATSNSTNGENEPPSDGSARNGTNRKDAKLRDDVLLPGESESANNAMLVQQHTSRDLRLSQSADFDFDHSDIPDCDIPAPISFNWREKPPTHNQTTTEAHPTSARVLRFPTWMKHRGLGTPSAEGPKTEFTDLKAVRKLNLVLSKKVPARNGHGHGAQPHMSTETSQEKQTNNHYNSSHEKLHNHHHKHVADELNDPVDEHGGSSLATASNATNPWRSSDSIAHDGHENALTRTKSGHGGKSLRKRIMQTLTGDSVKHGHGIHSPFRKGKADGPMKNKLRMFMRKGDVHPRAGSDNVAHANVAAHTASGNVKESTVDNWNISAAELGRGIGQHDDPEDDYMIENNAQTFDAANFKHLYSEDDSSEQVRLTKNYTPLENAKDEGIQFGRAASGSGVGIHLRTLPQNQNGHGFPKKEAEERTPLAKIARADSALNRISPLTPSVEVPKRGLFKK